MKIRVIPNQKWTAHAPRRFHRDTQPRVVPIGRIGSQKGSE